MSKFFVTNSSALFNSLKSIVDESPFKLGFSYGENVYCLTTKKLVVDNVNGTRMNDGFVASTGSLIWKEGEHVSEKVLKEIYSDYTDEPECIRQKSIGNYAVAICKNKKISIFGEKTGFYNIFYFNNNGIWLVSNSLYDIFLALKDTLSINKMAMIEFIDQVGIMWGDTIFNEIKRLRGFDYISIESNKFEVREQKCYFPMFEGSVDDAVTKYRDLSLSYATKASRAYGSPTIAMTGGMDARILLASYLAINANPSTYYGTGNSYLTNTFKQDWNINKIYESKFNLKFYDESWATPNPVDKYWDKYLKMFGLYYFIYTASDSVNESIINNPTLHFILGEGGEMLRNVQWLDETKLESFTIDDFINGYFLPQQSRASIEDPEEYIDYIKKKLECICDYYNIDPLQIKREDIFILTLERRKTADSSTVNWINFMKYDNAQMTEYDGLLCARLPHYETANGKFQLKCQQAIYPKIIDVPYFSHCQMRRVNKESMTLEYAGHSSLYSSLSKSLEMVSPSLFKSLRALLKKDKMHRHADSMNIYQELLGLAKRYNFIDYIKPEKLTNKIAVANLAMLTYALKDIKK